VKITSRHYDEEHKLILSCYIHIANVLIQVTQFQVLHHFETNVKFHPNLVATIPNYHSIVATPYVNKTRTIPVLPLGEHAYREPVDSTFGRISCVHGGRRCRVYHSHRQGRGEERRREERRGEEVI
jgi:hypothetical protein